MRRKAECGWQWWRPPQQCGPRPSPQVIGRSSPSLPDLPFPPLLAVPGRPSVFLGPACFKCPAFGSTSFFFFCGDPQGPGELGPGVGGVGRVCGKPVWSRGADAAGGSALRAAGGGGGSGAELDNSSGELGPAERLVELVPPLGDDAAWCTVTLGWGRVHTENQQLNLVQRVLYARPLRPLHLTSQQLFQDRIVVLVLLGRQLRPWMVR